MRSALKILLFLLFVPSQIALVMANTHATAAKRQQPDQNFHARLAAGWFMLVFRITMGQLGLLFLILLISD